MKNITWIAIIVLLLFIVAGAAYYNLNLTISAKIKEAGFSKRDIIAEEGYSLDADRITKVFLLADAEKLGIIGITSRGFGTWKNQGMDSILENPGLHAFVASSFAIMKNLANNLYTEKHVFVAGYIESQPNQIIAGNSDFYLNVDYFTHNGKTLLYGHAIAGKNKSSFGSDEVIQYIQSKLGGR